MRARSRDMRAFAATAAGLVLVALVGLASGGSPWHAGGGHGSVPTGVVRTVAAGAGVLVVGSLLLVWVGTPGTQKQRRRRRRLGARDLEELGASLSTAGKAAALVAAAVGLFLLISVLFVTPTATTPPGSTVSSVPHTRTTAPRRAGGHTDSNTLAWLVGSAAVTLLLLAPAAVVVRGRRARRARADAVPDLGAQVASGLRGSIAELEAEQDPRIAVQRAYGHMEEALGEIELVRARDETPSEFTTRVLRVVGASAASASDLTALFEVARFSDHTLGEGDRQRAIASARRVEAEVAQR